MELTQNFYDNMGNYQGQRTVEITDWTEADVEDHLLQDLGGSLTGEYVDTVVTLPNSVSYNGSTYRADAGAYDYSFYDGGNSKQDVSGNPIVSLAESGNEYLFDGSLTVLAGQPIEIDLLDAGDLLAVDTELYLGNEEDMGVSNYFAYLVEDPDNPGQYLTPPSKYYPDTYTGTINGVETEIGKYSNVVLKVTVDYTDITPRPSPTPSASSGLTFTVPEWRLSKYWSQIVSTGSEGSASSTLDVPEYATDPAPHVDEELDPDSVEKTFTASLSSEYTPVTWLELSPTVVGDDKETISLSNTSASKLVNTSLFAKRTTDLETLF